MHRLARFEQSGSEENIRQQEIAILPLTPTKRALKESNAFTTLDPDAKLQCHPAQLHKTITAVGLRLAVALVAH